MYHSYLAMLYTVHVHACVHYVVNCNSTNLNIDEVDASTLGTGDDVGGNDLDFGSSYGEVGRCSRHGDDVIESLHQLEHAYSEGADTQMTKDSDRVKL